jgi:hypothetical protein
VNEDENIVPVETAEVQEESVAETPQETESETQPETAASVVETPVSEVQTPAASEASPSETFENASALPDSAVKELLDAIKKELSASDEDLEETKNMTEETSSETSADFGDLPDGTDAEIALYEVPETDGGMVVDAYTIATDSNAEYRETVINRLDNILVCAIITACCAFLVLFHTLKKE